MMAVSRLRPDRALLRLTTCLLILLAIPFHARAAEYVVRAGDTLGSIAQRNHIALWALARANGIANINLIRIGQVLLIPTPARSLWYHVRWGDTLSGIASRFGTDIATLRSMNPKLGAYPLAGEWLRVCRPCSSGSSYEVSPQQPAGAIHIVQPGETLTSVAARFGVSPLTLISVNHITNPDRIIIGQALTIPSASTPGAYDPYSARALIVRYANLYGIEPSLPLAIGWQESGFNQTMVSRTGAVGVMQIEPYTAAHIQALLGRRLNVYNVDDNVHAGVYWLGVLLRYYGGDERLAVAAYYEGTRAIARHGFFRDTVQYVNDVLSLKSSFGG
jgi:LysM repeat protein